MAKTAGVSAFRNSYLARRLDHGRVRTYVYWCRRTKLLYEEEVRHRAVGKAKEHVLVVGWMSDFFLVFFISAGVHIESRKGL